MEKGQLEGKPVTLVREARQGDRGYDESKNQVLVEFEDGTQKVVGPEEVYGRKKNAPAPGGRPQDMRAPADTNVGAKITSTKTV